MDFFHCHRILQHIVARLPLKKNNTYPRWWLRKPLDLDELLLRILDPDIVLTLRGRPRLAAKEGGGDDSTQPTSQPDSQPTSGSFLSRASGARVASTQAFDAHAREMRLRYYLTYSFKQPAAPCKALESTHQ